MLEADFAEAVTPHETTFIHIAVDANNTPFTGILPHCDIPSICQYRLFLRVHGNHQFVVIDLSEQMSVVEVSERIQQGLLTVSTFYHTQETEERITELTFWQSSRRLNVNHRYQILLTRQTLGLEVLQLELKRRLGAKEMI